MRINGTRDEKTGRIRRVEFETDSFDQEVLLSRFVEVFLPESRGGTIIIENIDGKKLTYELPHEQTSAE